MSDDEIRGLAGQNYEGPQGLPQLTINHFAEDDDGNKLPRGQWQVFAKDAGGTVFGETVLFRPFLRTFSYAVWDNEEAKFSSQSVQLEGFNKGPFLDTTGTEKCGRLSEDELKGLDPNSPEAALSKEVKCTQLVYGLVSFEGADAEGNKQVVENLPCVWRARGASYNGADSILKELSKRKRNWHMTVLKLESEKKKKGGNNYFAASAVMSGEVDEFPVEEQEVMLGFMKTYRGFNAWVADKFVEARKGVATNVEDTLEAQFEEVDDPDDEIPF